MKGFLKKLFRMQSTWGTMTRTGFNAPLKQKNA